MDKLEKLKNLKLFKENPELAANQLAVQTNELLQELKPLLEEIAKKEFPPFPSFPAIPTPDFSETNDLLKQLLSEAKKEKPKEDINVQLKLE